MEDEVVRRPVEGHRERREDLPERLGGCRDIGLAGPTEVRLVTARNDPHLER